MRGAWEKGEAWEEGGSWQLEPDGGWKGGRREETLRMSRQMRPSLSTLG